MCGICGVLAEGGIDGEPFIRMRDSLTHRGPDEAGAFCEPPVSLGIRRLSIIDLERGQQPMTSEDGSVVVVQNGEIYNFQSLREQLLAGKHLLETRCDTEVIPHLYEDHGEDFVTHLRGMFGIALWDREKRRLVVARDRLGIKPMYYYEHEGIFAFASEIKALLHLPGFNPELDEAAIDLYLTFGYIPSPHSIFRHVRKLPPGHYLSAKDGRVEVRRYWKYPPLQDKPQHTERHYLEKLGETLLETVKLHLISDVPLGVFLSGGLDSSTLVMVMRELGVDPIETFSVGFEEKGYSELDYAREIARRYDTRHHEFLVRPDNVFETIPDMTRKFDEPFADSSALPVYLLSRFARRRVTVVLSGEGGDEIFGGYHTYVASKVADALRRFPLSLSLPAIRALAGLLPASMGKVSFDYKLKKFSENISAHPLESHLYWKRIFREEHKNELFPGDRWEYRSKQYVDNKIRECYNRKVVNNAMLLDSTLFLPDDLLVKNDRMSMAHSLEARVPFLDHRLVEYAATIPAGLKIKGTTKKYILKQLARKSLGDTVAMRQKAGFNLPLPMWLLETGRENLGDRILDEVKSCGYSINTAFVERILEEHRSRKKDWSRQLWTVFNFALWHKTYKKPTARP